MAIDNPLRALEMFGQSIWLDYIRRSLIASGELHRLIEEDGLRGVTSNPAIFEKAIAGSSDYKEELEGRDARSLDPKALYERLAIRDVQAAADELQPVYAQTSGRDGYVSLEVSPLLAADTAGTLEEARRLWTAVRRDNCMIKVPATPEGIPAIQQLVGEGINVNVTLLFARDAYERVAEAYLAGLEALAARGGDVTRVASVASFFISRIDTAVDALLDARIEASSDAREQSALRGLIGKAAIANAKLTFVRYQEIFAGPRWEALARRGARTQRLLWASTGTKNPAFRDVVYIEELIGPDTVNTMPPATLDAFRDHGLPRASLTDDVESAFDTMKALSDAGISMTEITDKLLVDGVRLFADAFAKLLGAVERQSRGAGAGRVNKLTFALPEALAAAVNDSLAEWSAQDNVRRMWAHDPSLWTGRDEGQWLGWLGVTNGQLAHVERLTRISEAARSAGFSDVLLLGMGGSSLCPEVMKATFGAIPGYPELHVLDSTDPAQVLAFERRVDLDKTLFIVSSKSGSTLEPNIFKQYFFDRIVQRVGAEEAGRRFIAITDPGSKVQQIAERDGFRHVFHGWPTIGGRYSALSDFGLVPAAIMGVDVPKLLDRTEEMVCACMPTVPVAENPGVVLGTILGVAARDFGRDKPTFVAAPALAAIGAWLEQLIAESTGKEGHGLIPIDREEIGAPEAYGSDRVFVHLTLRAAPNAGPDAAREAAVAALERAGHPVVRIAVDDVYDLGEEFFRWEIATAVAGSILGVHPFDQPDVEASKIATRKLTDEYENTGVLPAETPLFTSNGLQLFTDERNAAALSESAAGTQTLEACLESHLNRLRPGDYFAFLAYLDMNDSHARVLQAIRQRVRDDRHVATCLEFGPRFLHSTGQAYKGGPNTGVFLQITCDDANDIRVPGQKYTFGLVKTAQARGDFHVLLERGRRALRVHLGSDVAAGLATLNRILSSASSRQREAPHV